MVALRACPAAKRVPFVGGVAKLPIFGDFRRNPALF